MSIIEHDPTLSIPRQPTTGGHEILRTFEYPEFGVRVEAVGSRDDRLGAAFDLEVDAMSSLGDKPEEVRAEFLPYLHYSRYYLASPLDTEDLHAFGRMIPSTEAGEVPDNPYTWDQSKRPGLNKSLLDLAKIAGWSLPGLPEFEPEKEGSYTHDPHAIVDRFKTVYECDSLDTVSDITVLAPDMRLNRLQISLAAAGLMAAFTTEAAEAWAEGKLTHHISFNEVDAHGAFMGHGYSFVPLFGLPPMKYDSFHNGGEAMKAQIATLKMDHVIDALRAPQTRLLGAIAARPEVQDILRNTA